MCVCALESSLRAAQRISIRTIPVLSGLIIFSETPPEERKSGLGPLPAEPNGLSIEREARGRGKWIFAGFFLPSADHRIKSGPFVMPFNRRTAFDRNGTINQTRAPRFDVRSFARIKSLIR